MNTKDIKDLLIALAILVVLMVAAFCLGRCTGQMGADEGLIAHSDTVTVRDTVKIPFEKLETQVVTQEVVRYKYVPISVAPDTFVKHDTIIRVEDGVAVIPISLKTYTDSSTYKAVVSGYDPRLESIEVYQTNTVITNTVQPSQWSVGLQGGLYATPKGLQPGIGVGVQYSIPIRFKHN